MLHFIYKSREVKVDVTAPDKSVYQKLSQFDDESGSSVDIDEEEEEL